MPRQRREWRNIEDCAINVRDGERWFDIFAKQGKIKPWTLKNLPMPEYEKNKNFCRYHQMVGHLTVKCWDILEEIQELLNKGEIEYKATTTQKAPTANVMMVSHLTSLTKIPEKAKEEDG